MVPPESLMEHLTGYMKKNLIAETDSDGVQMVKTLLIGNLTRKAQVYFILLIILIHFILNQFHFHIQRREQPTQL